MNNLPSTLEFLEGLRAKAPKDVVKLELSMKFGQENKYVTARFKEKDYPEGIEILHLTDLQFGHKACNVARIEEYRDWVLSAANRFVFFGGDLIDAATLLSVGSPLENDGEPQDQVYRLVKMLMPLRHRVLGYVGGNHERRTTKTFGDAGRLISNFLQIPYSSGKQFVDIHYGAHKPFKNSLWHGGSGSKTKGSKCNVIHSFMRQADSQMYWLGHLHDFLYVGDVRETRDGKGGIKLQKYCGVMSSSFLEHWGTYAEVAGLSANDIQMWKLCLSPDGKWECRGR